MRRAKADPGVKAVVIRVDSPGGSALASDLMWREVCDEDEDEDEDWYAMK